MEPWLCCRTCLSVENLNPIYVLEEHKEKYSNVINTVTGIEISPNDTLPQHMCTSCINEINKSYKFRKKCIETQKLLTNNHYHNNIKSETTFERNGISLDISEFVDYESVKETVKIEIELIQKNPAEEIDSKNHSTITTKENTEISETKVKKKRIKKEPKSAMINKKVKTTKLIKPQVKKKKDKVEEKKQKVREKIECKNCHKCFKTELLLQRHSKVHIGIDLVCEHCGMICRNHRRLLAHCKAKHGYEKTDKCSFCDYKASNAELVKIHERLHTGEKPYTCSDCGAGFHRRSCYLQHIAIHLPDKTVQCKQCPAKFKSVTLMQIHLSRHRRRYNYKCLVCNNTFVRPGHVKRHLTRIHSMEPLNEHFERNKLE